MPMIGRPSAPGRSDPIVTSTSPSSGVIDQVVTVSPSATFNQAMDGSTFTTSTMLMTDHLGASIAGVVSWDSIGLRGIFNPTLDLIEGETYTVTVVGGPSGVKNLGGRPMSVNYGWTFTTVTPLPPPALVIVGFGSATTGGGNVGDVGTTLYTPTNYAEFKAAIQATGKRIIRPNAAVAIDGGGETITIDNPNLTIDGTNFHGTIKRLGIVAKVGNIILTQLRLHPGDQVNAPDDVDCISFNPARGGNWGNTLANIVIDHCSFLWAPDVTLAFLNTCTDVTVQYCILGAGLRYSTHFEATGGTNTHGYGPNNTTIGSNPQPNIDYGRRITYYRNYIMHNYTGRNIRGQGSDPVEYVNNVIYHWGTAHVAHINPRGANIVGNIFKKGPGTAGSNVVGYTDTDTSNPVKYNNSVWMPLAGGDANIGVGFTPTTNFDAGVDRTARYATTGGTLDTGLLTAATSGLANTIVAAAGPTFVDSVDQLMKDDWTNGTGDWWNGPSGAAPHPYWPTF